MTVPIMRQAHAVLNALDEGKVIGVINTISYLFDNRDFKYDKRKAVVHTLKNACGMTEEEINYWLDDQGWGDNL